MVSGVQCGSCEYGYTCDVTLHCVEITTDNAVLVGDEDFAQDPVPDVDTYDPNCPPLATAPFPYYKDDGSIHFCRPCDTPTEKDPQCVQNLWKEMNRKLVWDHPEYDCYPYPCEIPGLKPMTKWDVDNAYATFSIHECDLMLVPEKWYGLHRAIKQWNMSEGKVGLNLSTTYVDILKYTTVGKMVVYDIATQKYLFLGPVMEQLSYHDGFSLLEFADSRSVELRKVYRYAGYYGIDGSYRVVYPKPIWFFILSPANSDKWVFANIEETQNGPYQMMYAKVGEWEWTSLGDGYALMPEFMGDKLAFYIDDTGYVCDLAKSPARLSDCFLVNHGDEWAGEVHFDRQVADGSVFIYTSDYSRAIVRVDTSGPTPVYEDIVTDFSPDNNLYPYSLVAERADGNVILYHEVTGSEGTSSRACFYRLDTKKRYCMKMIEMDNSYRYGYAEFEGKWFLYQRHASTPLVLRDMDCYCEKEGVCPFEGLKR